MTSPTSAPQKVLTHASSKKSGGAPEITVESETLHDLIDVYVEAVEGLRGTHAFIKQNCDFHAGTGLLMLALKYVYDDARTKTLESVEYAREIAQSNREGISGMLEDLLAHEEDVMNACKCLHDEVEGTTDTTVTDTSTSTSTGGYGGGGGGYGGGGAMPVMPEPTPMPTPTTTGVADDGISDIDIDVTVDGDGNVTVNVDGDGDENVHLNVDVEGDGDVDVTIDSDLADGDSDISVNVDGDGEVNVNIDADDNDFDSDYSSSSDSEDVSSSAASASSTSAGGSGGGSASGTGSDPEAPSQTDDSPVFESGSGTPLTAEQQAKNAELYDELWEEQAANDPMGRSADELRTAWEEREPIDFADDSLADAGPLGYGEEAPKNPISFTIGATQGVQ